MTETTQGLYCQLQQAGPIPLRIEFRVAPGELMALIGPSGSGKTTILRAIAGLYRPRQGVIRCQGASWLDTTQGLDHPPQQRHCGLVFQDYALFPHLSVINNITIALGHIAPAQRQSRARELLQRVHLSGLETRLPRRLSGGQQQRVALARALARDPAVLLLDEPFSAVDQVTRRKLQQELVLLRRQIDIPMLLVTHDLNEAAALADRMLVIHKGRGLQTDRPEELFSHPASRLAARLLDMGNIFRGRLSDDGRGRARLCWHDFQLDVGSPPGVRPGKELDWVIPSSHILLHRRDHPSRGERENPVPGRVHDLLVLGDTARIDMRVPAADDAHLYFTIPSHVARRNGLETGCRITVSLLREGIHLMPADGLEPDGRAE